MKRWVAVLGVLILVLSLTTTAFAADKAQVRAINGSVNGKAVDILIADKAAFTKVALGAGTEYAGFEAGTLAVKIVAAGTTTPVLAQASIDAKAGQAYCIAVIGTSDKVEVIVVSDAKNVPVAGKAVARVINNALDLPTADIGAAGKAPIWKGVAPKTASDYVAIDPGAHEFWGYIAGTTQGVPSGKPVELEAGKVYSLVVSGFPVLAGAPVELYAIVDPALPAAGAALPTTGGEASLAVYLLASAAGLLTLGGLALRRR